MSYEVTHKQEEQYKAHIEDLHKEIRELEDKASLTLKDVPLRKRIKRAAFGLTVDWVRYRKNS